MGEIKFWLFLLFIDQSRRLCCAFATNTSTEESNSNEDTSSYFTITKLKTSTEIFMEATKTLPNTSTTSFTPISTTSTTSTTTYPLICERDTQYIENEFIDWPQIPSGTCTESNPLLIDSSFETIKRFCIGTEWTEPPLLATIQPNEFFPCIDGYIYHSPTNLCYIFTENSAFLPACPLSFPLPFQAVVSLLQNEFVWVPVKRYKSTYYWEELTEFYKQSTLYSTGELHSNDCLVQNTNGVLSVPCDQNYPRLCAYRSLETAPTAQHCQQLGLCHHSDYLDFSACFCVRDQLTSEPLATLVKPYQNQIVYKLKLPSTCVFGLVRSNNYFYWNFELITYTNWHRNVKFDNVNKIGLINEQKWDLANDSYGNNCFICSIQPALPIANLTLTKFAFVFLIIVDNLNGFKQDDNGNILLFCFYETKNGDFVRFTMDELYWRELNILYLINQGEGWYWCEAFSYPYMDIIKTEKLYDLVEDSCNNYHYKLNISKTCNFTSRHILEQLQQVVPLNTNLKLDYKIKNSTIEIKATSFLNHVQNQSSVFDQIKDFVAQSIGTKVGTIEEIFYCCKETTNQEDWLLTWPASASSPELIHPVEFCLQDSYFVNRTCLDGGVWSPVSYNCITYFPNPSFLTRQLIALFIDSNSERVTHLATLSHQFATYTAQDFYLSTLMLAGMVRVTCEHFSNLIVILDNLVQVAKEVASEAERRFNATHSLIDTFRKLVPNSVCGNFDQEANTFYTYIGAQVKAIAHIAGLKSYPMDCASLEINYHFCITFGDEIAKSFQNVLVLAFYRHHLFPTVNAKLLSQVIELNLINATRSSPINITYNTSPMVEGVIFCGVWNQEKQNHWTSIGQLTQINTKQFTCTISENGIFGLLQSTNVSDDLNDILGSTMEPEEVITDLLQVTYRHSEFSNQDVYLVGEILGKVDQSNPNFDINYLEYFATAIHNLHYIERDVLRDAQLTQGATDSILLNIDAIVKTQTNNCQIVVGCFLLIILDLSNVTGIVVYRGDKLKFDVLTGKDKGPSDNIETLLLLTTQLKSQFPNNSKLIVTFHLNDALFNSEAKLTTGNIFGVILPTIQTPYNSPVKIIHNVSTSKAALCSYWGFKPNGTSEWISNQSGKQIGEMLECEYYHTTHFSLLLTPNHFDLPLLNEITLINCLLSGFGLFGIVLTAILFKRFRINTGNQLLLNFVAAMSMQLVGLYLSGSLDQNNVNYPTCIAIGALLHFAVLSEFFWMFVIGVLQFRRFVEVLGAQPKYVLLKTCLFGWGLPLIPIILLLVFDRENYANGINGFCYPTGLGLLLGVWLPVGTIVFINTILFICIIYNVLHKKTNSGAQYNSDIVLQWRLAILLFFMLGLAWSFGFLAQLRFGVVFIYLFTFTASLQGFVMFLYFIVFNQNTRNMYGAKLKSCMSKSKC